MSIATNTQISPPAKRAYTPPTLVVHGDVQALTHGPKIGTDPDLDGQGSFIPDGPK